MPGISAMSGSRAASVRIVVGLAGVLAGCTMGPDFHKPTVEAVPEWHRSLPPAESQVTTTTVDPAWWTLFNDPILTRLEARVAASNLDLKAATLRLVQSGAERRIATAALLPHMQANASYAREQASTNGILGLLGTMERAEADSIANGAQGFGPAGMPGSVGNPSFNLPQYGMSASWEIDFWGHVLRQVEAASAAERLTEDQRRDMFVSLMAQTAQTYIDLRATQAQIDILNSNIDIAHHSVDLTKKRFEQGSATRLDVAEATGQLHSFESRLPPLQSREVHLLNALSFLVAREPGALTAELGRGTGIPPVPAQVPVGLPSQLAERRPDIRMAVERLHMATASVGVAQADFFPRVTLTGSLDIQALQFSGLGSWASRQYGWGPTVSLPIFEGGRLRGQLHLREAQQKEAATMFQRTVLKAWQEIDDAMSSFTAAQTERDRLAEAVHENEIAVQTAKMQYEQGASDFLNVLTVQNALLASQSQLVAATAHVSGAVTTLYQALGGGWQKAYPQHHASDTPAVQRAGAVP